MNQAEYQKYLAEGLLTKTAREIANDYKEVVKLRAVCMSLDYPQIGDLLRKTCTRCINSALDFLAIRFNINRYKAKKNGERNGTLQSA